MLSFFESLFNLRWKPTPKQRPLPPHIQRSYVTTPDGDLELLVCHPKTPNPALAPIVFAHGGFGSAGVWLEWMNYLHAHGYGGAMYAYSVRNHGASYPVPYRKMVHGTSMDDVASDLVAVIKHVAAIRIGSGDPVVVAHSAGGALTQYVLSRRLATVSGLCLVGAMPHFGGIDAFWNWFKFDPWMLVRSWFCANHPSSVLSTPALVHRAFFGPRFPRGTDDGWVKVREFMGWMAPYESMGWAQGGNGSFWKWLVHGRNEWLDVRDILRGVTGWERSTDRICILVGSHDGPMDLKMANRQFAEFKDGVRALQDSKKIDPASDASSPVVENSPPIPGVSLERGDGVQLVVVQDAGHHVQNDVQCDEAAEAIRRWLVQL